MAIFQILLSNVLGLVWPGFFSTTKNDKKNKLQTFVNLEDGD
jgi:hypothetical protein